MPLPLCCYTKFFITMSSDAEVFWFFLLQVSYAWFIISSLCFLRLFRGTLPTQLLLKLIQSVGRQGKRGLWTESKQDTSMCAPLLDPKSVQRAVQHIKAHFLVSFNKARAEEICHLFFDILHHYNSSLFNLVRLLYLATSLLQDAEDAFSLFQKRVASLFLDRAES